MKKSFKCSSIPVLSKLAKATMIALPCALLSITMAHAVAPYDDPEVPNYPVTTIDFPVVGDEEGDLTQLYLNHIYSSVWGNNLIVNPSFDLCGELVEPQVYVMDETWALDNPGEATNRECGGHLSWMRSGWHAEKLLGGRSNKANLPNAPTTDGGHYAPPNWSGRTHIAAMYAPRDLRLQKVVEVRAINEIYFAFDFSRQKQEDIRMRLELTPTDGEMFEISFRPSEFDNDEYWFDADGNPWLDEEGKVVNYWKNTGLAWSLDTPFTGTIDFYWRSGTGGIARVDNFFLGTDATVLALPDSDGDGTFDGFDQFRDNAAAYLDTDGDGLPDSFTANYCKELITAEGEDEEGEVIPAVYGDDFSECNGLTLDTDDDNDGGSDIDEEAAGTNPLDDKSILADRDGDVCYNANVKGLQVDDAYPDSHYLFLAKEKYTNVLTDYAADAENAVVIGDVVGSETYEWSSFSFGSGAQDYDVIDTTGRNGESTKAFRLAVSSTGVGDNLIEFKSPTLTTVNQNVRVVRLAGWFKITGPEVIDDDTRVSVGVKSTRVDGSEKNNRQFWTFTEGSPDRAIYNIDLEDNNGCYYFDQPIYIGNDEIADIKMSLQLDTKSDIVGMEVLFDDLELNLVPFNISRDQDLDGILNGNDDTPLGDGAFDASLGDEGGYAPTASLDTDNDGILNGYDDDLDGDGIANAFDNFHLAITIDEADAVHDPEARTITIAPVVTENSALEPESGVVLEYNWTVKQKAFGADDDDDSFAIEKTYSDPTLVINELDFVGNLNIVIELTVTAETPQGGTVVQKRVWDQQDIANDFVPTIALSMVHFPGDKAVFNVSNLFDLEDDALLITWTVDGVAVSVSDNATNLTLNYADYSAAAKVAVTATVSEVNRPVHQRSHSLTWFIPAEPKKPYSGNQGASMHWWLLALLSMHLFTRRNRK